jgi:hypothetical protein
VWEEEERKPKLSLPELPDFLEFQGMSICFERAMSFVQKEDVLIVLDETQLGFATFILPKFHHFKFGLFDVCNRIWIQKLQ